MTDALLLTALQNSDSRSASNAAILRVRAASIGGTLLAIQSVRIAAPVTGRKNEGILVRATSLG